jgi:hypothetical protein
MIAAISCAGTAEASVSQDVLKETRGEADPDWPCIQRKVPELSPAAVWQGPPIDAALDTWDEDENVADLVRDIASRRTPIDEAKTAIAKFAEGLDPAEGAEKLTSVFAGLFQTLNRERGEIIDGIGRYARKQVALADRIRQEQSVISEQSAADPQAANALNEQLLAEIRIFNERRQSLAFVCETPVLLEQRLFELARAIQSQMPKQ